MPALLLDKEKCLKNMEKMAGRASTNQLKLRPTAKHTSRPKSPIGYRISE